MLIVKLQLMLINLHILLNKWGVKHFIVFFNAEITSKCSLLNHTLTIVLMIIKMI